MTSKDQSGLVGLDEVIIDHPAHDTSCLEKNIVNSIEWSGVNVIVPDRETEKSK